MCLCCFIHYRMVKSTRGVPKPRKEDLVIDDGSEQEEWRKYKKTDDAKPMPKSML